MPELTKDVVMQDCGGCISAGTEFHVYLHFIFHERSLGIVLHWNGRDHWCLDESPVVSFGMRDEALVVITMLTWCCTRIQGVISAFTSVQSEGNHQVSPVHRNCWESVKMVSVTIFCFEINLLKLSLLTNSKISALTENQRSWVLLVVCACVNVHVCVSIQI
jgi:hypothetical protein